MVKLKKKLIKDSFHKKPKNKSIKNKSINTEALKKRKMKKFRKIKISKHSKYLKNPSLNHFNYNSHFIYDLDEVEKFFKNTKNKNSLKVNQKELNTLNRLIEEIDLNKENKENTVFISINKEKYNIIKSYVEVKEMNNPLTSFIKRQLENKEKRYLLSCRKIANLYYEETGIKTNRTSVNTIIRDKFGYKYLKTIPKNRIITSHNNMLISFSFIKIIVKCLNLGFKIIYIDESVIKNKNK